MCQIKELAKESNMTVSEYVHRLVEKSMEEVWGPREMEYVEITVRIPKPLNDFIESYFGFVGVDPQAFWEREVIGDIGALLETLEGQHLSPEGLIKRYGLAEALADH
jgi:hypothetical protein